MVGIIDLVGHLSNALFAIGAGFRNVVYFRAILVVAALLEVVYDFYISTFPLWTPIFWGIALILIKFVSNFFGIIYPKQTSCFEFGRTKGILQNRAFLGAEKFQKDYATGFLAAV